MKKLLKLFAICGALFIMIACSSSPTDQIVSTFEKATKEIQKAKNKDDAMKIVDATRAKIEKIVEKAGDNYEPSKADKKKIVNAAVAFAKAAYEKGCFPWGGFGIDFDCDDLDFDDFDF